MQIVKVSSWFDEKNTKNVIEVEVGRGGGAAAAAEEEKWLPSIFQFELPSRCIISIT